MKFYIPPTIKSDFEDWLNTDVANVNYDFEIIRDWYAQAAVKRIRATYFPIAWKSKIGNSDTNSNFKTGYGWEIRKGDLAVREDGTIYMLNWQVQRNPNNQSTQAIACNARLSFARHMDEVLDGRGFLVSEAMEKVIAPDIPCVYAEYTGRPDYAANYNTPGISADHLLTVQLQLNSRTDEIRIGDTFALMHSKYRIVNRVDSEIEIGRRHGIINLMARRIAGEEQR